MGKGHQAPAPECHKRCGFRPSTPANKGQGLPYCCDGIDGREAVASLSIQSSPRKPAINLLANSIAAPAPSCPDLCSTSYSGDNLRVATRPGLPPLHVKCRLDTERNKQRGNVLSSDACPSSRAKTPRSLDYLPYENGTRVGEISKESENPLKEALGPFLDRIYEFLGSATDIVTNKRPADEQNCTS